MSLIFFSGEELLPARLNALPNCKGVWLNPSGSSTTTSSSFADTASTSSVSFTKVDDQSRLRVDFHATCYVTGSVPDEVEFAVRFNSVDYLIAEGRLETASVHKQFSGVRIITVNAAAGTYTVQGRWRRSSGSGTITMDTNDFLSFAVSEAQE